MVLSILAIFLTLHALAVCVDDNKDAHHVPSTYLAATFLVASFFIDDHDLQKWYTLALEFLR